MSRLFKKFKKRVAWWLIKDLVEEGLPYLRIGKNTVDLLPDSIKFPALTSDPSLEAVKLWYRSDLDEWRYTPDGTTVKKLGAATQPDNVYICTDNQGRLTICDNSINGAKMGEYAPRFVASDNTIIEPSPYISYLNGPYYAGQKWIPRRYKVYLSGTLRVIARFRWLPAVAVPGTYIRIWIDGEPVASKDISTVEDTAYTLSGDFEVLPGSLIEVGWEFSSNYCDVNCQVWVYYVYIKGDIVYSPKSEFVKQI